MQDGQKRAIFGRPRWLKRLWGVRHARWAWQNHQVRRWAAQWGSIGIGLGAPHPSDLEILDQIWRGEA